MPERKATALRSGFLLLEGQQTQSEPFRYSYTMRFPSAEQKALRLLAKLLYFREDFEDNYFPVFRGSHNLAHLHAAAQDILSVARTLAAAAADIDGELSKREREAAKLADKYAVKAARLAAEIGKAIAEIAPGITRRTKG